MLKREKIAYGKMKEKIWKEKEWKRKHGEWKKQVRHASFLESQLWIYLDTENEEIMLCIIKYRKQLLRNRRRNK